MIPFTSALKLVVNQAAARKQKELIEEIQPSIDIEAEARGLPQGTKVNIESGYFEIEESVTCQDSSEE